MYSWSVFSFKLATWLFITFAGQMDCWWNAATENQGILQSQRREGCRILTVCQRLTVCTELVKKRRFMSNISLQVLVDFKLMMWADMTYVSRSPIPLKAASYKFKSERPRLLKRHSVARGFPERTPRAWKTLRLCLGRISVTCVFNPNLISGGFLIALQFRTGQLYNTL